MNSIGDLFRVSTWGESHGPALGAVIDGCPPGILLNETLLQADLDRRKPGPWKTGSSARTEPDQVEILSGVFEGKTLGTPISLMVRNQDARSEDYEKLKDLHRKGHADFTYEAKFGHRDWRGGGRASGRETVARVLGGTVAKQILKGVDISAYIQQVGRIIAPLLNKNITQDMQAAIEKAQAEGNSLGGIIEIHVTGLPAGLGSPVFGKLEAELGKALLSVGTVKGFEIGNGFERAALSGIEAAELPTDGVAGGISDGTPLILRVALKAPSSPALKIGGRHDACILPRVTVILENMVAIVLADQWLKQKAISSHVPTLPN